MFLPQLIISMLLFMVLFFGIGFIINMLLKTSWVMAVCYPFIVIIMIDKLSTWEYVINPGESFSALGARLASLTSVDILVLAMGFIGAIIAGVVIKMLRVRGYQMF
ncbi:YuiB-like putative membrane protein [Scopulibacillus darangshiensis]|uniref:YuiB-like putative membrane protein n=1 Tax=Scopulibacillus darangshiensis TaxID=442528 RepID=A0A4R2NY85_9BACL|nr:YuiB family protein [Scopulibacillus darangshiensis]TCP26584.1 YuiB-like putative membrane protein [Scopulibacillus darangshiensis]